MLLKKIREIEQKMASKISEDEMIEAIVLHKELVTLFELRRMLNEGRVYITPVRLMSDNFDKYAQDDDCLPEFTIKSEAPRDVFMMLTNYLKVHRGCKLELRGGTSDTATVIF